MSWLTQTVVAPLAGVLVRRAVPILVGVALGALAAAGLIPQEVADCAQGLVPTPSVSSLSSPGLQPGDSH